MSFQTLLPLIKKTKSNLSPEAFQSKINVIFHNYEAHHYDRLHQDMKQSLQEQIDLLVEDVLSKINLNTKKLNLLDVGCGTGMSTELILNSKLGEHIESVTLLDSSPNMLQYAEEKAKKWNQKYQIINSYVEQVSQKFDVVIICSVLHHIPDLH